MPSGNKKSEKRRFFLYLIMETVTLKPLFHNSKECIGIYSPQNAALNHYFQKKAGAKWSRTQQVLVRTLHRKKL